jgi:hypothetical protein
MYKVLILLTTFVFLFVSDVTSEILPKVPPIENLHRWTLKRDGTMEIEFPSGFRARYQIKAWSHISNCDVVRKRESEYVFITHVGPQAFEYITENVPSMYSYTGMKWHWYSSRTFEE